MCCIKVEKYWCKHPQWKQPKYHCYKKCDERWQNLKDVLQVTSCDEWQSDYETSDNSVNYSITQSELYEGRYPKSMKILMSTMPHHTFGKLFQLCTGHGGRGKCSQMNCVRERNGYCEYFQLETIERVLKEWPLNPAEQDMLKKVSLKLDHIKSAGFTTVTLLLIDRYIRAACWGFTECQSLVSTYWVLCIAGSLEHMELFIKNSVW